MNGTRCVAALGALAPIANAGLATLLFLGILLTFYWLGAGALRVPNVRKPDETWWEAFCGTGPGLAGDGDGRRPGQCSSVPAN